MYKNRSDVKDNRFNLRFNDREDKEIRELAELEGLQPTSLLRIGALAYLKELKQRHGREFNKLTKTMEDTAG